MGVLLGVSYFKYVFPLLLSFGFLIVYISMVTNVQITKVQVQGEGVCIIAGINSFHLYLCATNSSDEPHYLHSSKAFAFVLDNFIHIFLEGMCHSELHYFQCCTVDTMEGRTFCCIIIWIYIHVVFTINQMWCKCVSKYGICDML